MAPARRPPCYQPCRSDERQDPSRPHRGWDPVFRRYLWSSRGQSLESELHSGREHCKACPTGRPAGLYQDARHDYQSSPCLPNAARCSRLQPRRLIRQDAVTGWKNMAHISASRHDRVRDGRSGILPGINNGQELRLQAGWIAGKAGGGPRRPEQEYCGLSRRRDGGCGTGACYIGASIRIGYAGVWAEGSVVSICHVRIQYSISKQARCSHSAGATLPPAVRRLPGE